MTLVIAWRTTNLIEGGHRGLQAYRPICYYFYVFYVFYFFSKSKKRDFLRFLPCFIRFLELCLEIMNRKTQLVTAASITKPVRLSVSLIQLFAFLVNVLVNVMT